jgi:hypothetical protein
MRKRHRLTIDLSVAELAFWASAATSQGVSVSDLIRCAMISWAVANRDAFLAPQELWLVAASANEGDIFIKNDFVAVVDQWIRSQREANCPRLGKTKRASTLLAAKKSAIPRTPLPKLQTAPKRQRSGGLQ